MKPFVSVTVNFLIEVKGGITANSKDITYDLDELVEAYSSLGTSVFAFDLSRVFKWYNDKNFGVVSAYLGGKPKEENEQRQEELKKDVREMGYGYKEMLGVWRPDPESPAEFEYSLFIPAISPEDTVTLGKKYGQYAVIFLRKGCIGFHEIFRGRL